MTDCEQDSGAAAIEPSRLPVLAGGAARLPGAARAPGAAWLPGSARPAGLALRFDGASFHIVIGDESGATALTLGPYDDGEVVAIWRSLAAASGLPLLVSGPTGALEQPYRQLGRILLGPRSDPRRLAVLSGRRPRFLVRRKTARLPGRPLVYREREIASGRLS